MHALSGPHQAVSMYPGGRNIRLNLTISSNDDDINFMPSTAGRFFTALPEKHSTKGVCRHE